MAETPIIVGVEDLYFATLTSETFTTSWANVYATPEVLAKSIELTITPKIIKDRLAASNNYVRQTDKVTGYDVSFRGDAVTLANRAKLFGRTLDVNGGMKITPNDVAPYVAIGFKGTKDASGAAQYVWLYKGKFAEFEQAFRSQTPDAETEYQTPTITGEFVARKDGNIGYWLDEETATTAGDTVIAAWFDDVVEPGAAAAG